MDEIWTKDATAQAAMVAKGEISPDELLDAALARVAALNPGLNAVVLIKEDVARASIKAGLPDGPFRGVPFLLKDLGAEARDFPSHNGSKLLANTRYSYDSHLYQRIRATGAVTFGRTTSPEGGIGAVTEAAVYGGPTRNPWNPDHTSGGSSGGAGAAVAAGIVPMAHGSDGGGSVRIPASSCGLFGFKPTRARFSDGPAVGEGWAGMAIDGFLSRSVRDNAAMMDACAGSVPGDPYTAPPMPEGYLAATTHPPRRLRIGLCSTDFTGRAIHADCRAAVTETAHLLESLGHDVVPLRPEADHEMMIHAWTRIVACGTALSIRQTVEARGKPLEEGEIQGVSRSAMAFADRFSGADYLHAVGQIHAYGRQMATVFADCDILLSATLAEPPARVGRFHHDRDDFENYRVGPEGIFAYSPFCAAFNASGQPAASVPLHWSSEGLPIGIHLAAAFGNDAELIALCAELEQARPWADRWPQLARGALAKQNGV